MLIQLLHLMHLWDSIVLRVLVEQPIQIPTTEVNGIIPHAAVRI